MILTKNIKYFLALVKSGSVSKSASDMNITSSAISHSIKKLEIYLGFELFNKTKYGLTLTFLGKKFHEEIVQPIEILNAITCTIKKLKQKNDIVIKTDGIYYHKVFNSLDKIKKINSRKTISITTEISTDIKTELKKNFSDIIISTTDIKLTDDQIVKIDLTPETVGILINKDLYYKYKCIKDIFNNEKLIHSPSTVQHTTFKNFLKKLSNYDLNPSIISMNEIDILNCLKKGMGFSICVEGIYDSLNLKEKNLIYIKKPFSFDCKVYRKAYFLHENRNELLEFTSVIDT